MSAAKIMKTTNSGILLERDPVKNRSLINNNTHLLMDPNIWHAFIIRTKRSMTRNEILKLIINYVQPHEFIPLGFEALESLNEYIFFARDCSSAIHRICSNNLIIPDPFDGTLYLECEIILHYATLYEVKNSIKSRMRPIFYSLFNSATKTINLDKFADNENLADYLPLSISKVLHNALNVASSFNPSVIRLRNNDIKSLNSTEMLWKCPSLTHLDLRNNKIEDLSSFGCLKGLKLTEIDLDGNPLCSTMDAHSYVTELKKLFPSLQKIDGESVMMDGVPSFKRNYLCDTDGFNLVNNFIDTYFFRYDKDRKSLEDLYHPNAMWSITNIYKIGQVTSNDAKLRPYQGNCRNLLAIVDLTRSHQYLLMGKQSIIKKLCDLPQVEHDTFSFSTDLTYFSDKFAVINVSGVFREMAESILHNDRYVGFMRTFCITNYKGEYVITNDMFHVYNALSNQVINAFKTIGSKMSYKLPIARTSKEKEKAVEAMKIITGLKTEWSKRLLDDHGYNISESVKSFMDMYKVDKLPSSAFEDA